MEYEYILQEANQELMKIISILEKPNKLKGTKFQVKY